MTKQRTNPMGGKSKKRSRSTPKRNTHDLQTYRAQPYGNPSERNILSMVARPSVRPTRRGLVIANQELILNPQTASGAGLNSYSSLTINPASGGVFTWASRMVQNYSYYRFRKLRFLFNSGLATTTNGSIYLSHFRDYNDQLSWITTPDTQSLTYSEGTQVGALYASTIRSLNGGLWSDIMLDIDCVSLHSRVPWYLAASTITASNSNQTVALWLATAVNPTGTVSQFTGQIICDYEIELIHSVSSSNNVTRFVDDGVPDLLTNSRPSQESMISGGRVSDLSQLVPDDEDMTPVCPPSSPLNLD